MSSFAFRTEFMASFEAASGGIFKEEWIKYDEDEPDNGRYFIAVDLAGFENVAAATTAKKKRLDQSAIAIVRSHLMDGTSKTSNTVDGTSKNQPKESSTQFEITNPYASALSEAHSKMRFCRTLAI